MGISLYGLSSDAKAKIIRDNTAYGWHQVNASMAFERDLEDSISLCSYSTCIADFHSDGLLRVNINAFDCSRTTIQHFSKWLNRHNIASYTEVKALAKHARDIMMHDGTEEVYQLSNGNSLEFIY